MDDDTDELDSEPARAGPGSTLRRTDFVAGSRQGRTPALQGRSRDTEKRIVDAALALCDGRDYAEISVGAICDAADVSPSSFYSRFRDGDALLSALHEHYLDTMFNAIVAGMAEPDWGRRTLDELVVRFCELFLETGLQHEKLFRTMQRTEIGKPGLRAQRIRFERAGLELMVDLVAERYDHLDTTQRRRLIVAWSSLFATLREILGPLDKVNLTSLPEPDLLRELADQFCAYVKLPTAPPASS